MLPHHQRKKYPQNLILLFFLIAVSVALNGCTFGRLFHRHHVTYITVQDSVNIHVAPIESEGHKISQQNYRLFEERTKTTFHHIAKDTLTIKTSSYCLTESKKGYLPWVTKIKKNHFNWLKVVDLAVPALYLYLFFTNPDVENGPLGYGIYYYTLGGIWFNILPGPYTTFASVVRLPALIPIKYRENDENRVYVKDVVADTSNTLTSEDYSSFSDFRRHYPKYGGNMYKSKLYMDIAVAKAELNQKLKNWGYIDTTGLFSRLYSGAYIAKCRIAGYSEFSVGSYSSSILQCVWNIYTPDGNKKLVEFTTNDTSNSGVDNGRSIPGADNITRSLNNFLKNDEVIKVLKEKPVSAMVDTVLKPISVSQSAIDSVNNLQDALQAVVTIKTKSGFFSGCIISSDGYVVTNAHLLNDEDKIDTLDVHLSSGDSTTAKFIRSNSVYDMALYRITKPGHYKCFLPDTSHAIKLGQEVYAIGTAQELRLKQTTTKGIISGKRRVKDKYVIQTDASINSGSSGGALVNKNGHLVGIINTRFVGVDIQGIGFAVPGYYILEALNLNK